MVTQRTRWPGEPRPLSCRVGLHKWKRHPSSSSSHEGKYCTFCHDEIWKHS